MSQDQMLTQKSKDEKPILLEKDRRLTRRDSDLQLSRRIDWRFLLPNPHLQRVAYVGPDSGALFAALNRFSDSLTIISPLYQTAHVQGNQSAFDLVVVHSRNLADIEKAHSLFTTAGYLYWEIDRTNWFTSLHGIMRREGWKERWGLHLLRDSVIFLEQLEFCDIEVHWHYPNFETCLEITPLHDRLALDYVFSRYHMGLGRQLKLIVGRYLTKTRLLPYLVPCFSIIARKRLASPKAV